MPAMTRLFPALVAALASALLIGCPAERSVDAESGGVETTSQAGANDVTEAPEPESNNGYYGSPTTDMTEWPVGRDLGEVTSRPNFECGRCASNGTCRGCGATF